MIIAKYTLIRFFKKPVSFAMACVTPLALMFLSFLWEGDNQLGLALLTFVVMSSGFITSQTILTDRLEGTITRILVAPISKFRYLTESLIATSVPIIIQLLLVATAGMVLHDWSFIFAIAIFICYGALGLASVAMSFAWYQSMKSKESSTAGLSMLITLMAFLGGVFMPLEIMPGILSWIGGIFPVFWAVRGLNEAVTYGEITGDYMINIAVMFLFTLGFLYLGAHRRIS